MINWQEILSYAPADCLALISYHLSNEHYHQAAHMIELYGTPNIMAPILSACDKQKDMQAALCEMQIELIDLITEILKSRCADNDPSHTRLSDTDAHRLAQAQHDTLTSQAPVKHPLLQGD